MEEPRKSPAGPIAAVVAAVLLLGGLAWWRSRPAEEPPPAEARAGIIELLQAARYPEAYGLIVNELEARPRDPVLHMLAGRCSMKAKAFDRAVSHFRATIAEKPEAAAIVGVELGISLVNIAHAAEALPFLEKPGPPEMEGDRRLLLAECYLYLERYDEMLQRVPDHPGYLWARHRALLYQGKGEEAKALLDGRPPRETDFLRALQLREEGDFAGAARVVREGQGGDRLKRAALSLAVESGELDRIEPLAAELAGSTDPMLRSDALYYRALGHLLAGRRDAARAAAREFLDRTDADFSPIRIERMQMRYLAGELKEADLEAEAKQVSRFYANDLLAFLAFATGDRARAGQALAATPGRNFPYHALKRMAAP